MDMVGRIMAPSLTEQLGQQVIVENVGGAGGMTGAARVAKAAPDGCQFVLGNVGTHAVSQTLSKNPPYNVAADFAPVALIADLSLVLVARKDLPAANLQEFIAYAKANQDKMQFGSAERRLGDASRLRAAQRRDRRQRHAHSLSRRRAGDAGSGRRPHRLSLHRHADRHPADRGRADQGARDPHPWAFGEPAEFAVGAGAGACRFRGGQLGGVLPAQGHARADRGRSSRAAAPRRQTRRPCRSV